MKEKQVIMEAYFDVSTIAGDSIESLLKDERYYADVGGFEIEVDGKTVPFDFEATAMRVEKDGTCVFGNYEGFLERIYDVDPCHEDIWEEQGLEKEDITAELLASADKLTEFYLGIYCYDDTSIPYSLKVKDMLFTNENDETFSIDPSVLDDFNRHFLAEQYACFMCKYGPFEFRPSTISLYQDLVKGSMESITPYGTLNMINFVQNSCYEPGIRGHADFLIDQLVSSSVSKDSIFRVSLMDCTEIPDDANPFADFGNAESKYFYCDSLEKCQTAVSQYIEVNGLGARSWGGGFVYRGNEYIGQISYNGRFWNKYQEYGAIDTYKDTPALAMEKALQKNMPLLKESLAEEIENSRKESLDERIDKASVTGEGKDIDKDIGKER